MAEAGLSPGMNGKSTTQADLNKLMVFHQEDERAERASEGPAGPDTAGSAEKWAGIYPTGAFFQY